MTKRFGILGGYGNTGLLIAELLLHYSKVELVLIGRNLEKAQAEARRLNLAFETDRVSAQQVDAADAKSLRSVLESFDMLIAASSTTKYVETVARAALETGTDYFDIQLSIPAKLDFLKSISPEIERAGRCFITDGGFHPGLPAAMVRYAAGYFDQLEKANVASLMRINWKKLSISGSTKTEFAEELKETPLLAFREGSWKKLPFKQMPKFDFGAGFRQVYTVPMYLEEMHSLPEMIPSLKETGFFVSGFNWFVDYLVMPIGLVAMKILPHSSAGLVGDSLQWGLVTFSKPPYITVLKLEANGWRNGNPAELQFTISHEDGYLLTAAPVVACLLQYLDGEIGQPGLWYQANVVKPNRLFYDLQRMGLQIEIHKTVTEPVLLS